MKTLAMLQALALILSVARALGPQRAPWGSGKGLGHGEPLRSIKGALEAMAKSLATSRTSRPWQRQQ